MLAFDESFFFGCSWNSVFCFVSFCFLCFWQFSIYVALWVYPSWSSLTFLNASLIFSIIWKPFIHYCFFQLSFPLYSSSETPFLYVWDAVMSHGFLRLYFSSFSPLFCSSNWIISVDLFSAYSGVLLISSSEFFIHSFYCIFEL